jgi:hypothetical protein
MRRVVAGWLSRGDRYSRIGMPAEDTKSHGTSEPIASPAANGTGHDQARPDAASQVGASQFPRPLMQEIGKSAGGDHADSDG